MKRVVQLQIKRVFHRETWRVIIGDMFPRNPREAEMGPCPASREPTIILRANKISNMHMVEIFFALKMMDYFTIKA